MRYAQPCDENPHMFRWSCIGGNVVVHDGANVVETGLGDRFYRFLEGVPVAAVSKNISWEVQAYNSW